MGERTPLALIDAPASGRMAVGEAITNLAARRRRRARATSSCRRTGWRPPATPARTPRCTTRCARSRWSSARRSGVSIPVGKDSMSMRTTWRDGGVDKAVTAPVSLIVSAFAPVADARRDADAAAARSIAGDTALRAGSTSATAGSRLGGSALAQVYGQLGNDAPDLDDPARLAAFFARVQALQRDGRLLAYHDIADGGLFATLARDGVRRRAAASTSTLDGIARRRRSPRCSPRSWARSCRCARATRGRGRARLAPPGSRCTSSARPTPDDRIRIAQRRRARARRGARRPASRVVGDDARAAAAARQPGRRRPGVRRASLDAADPGLSPRARRSIPTTTSPRRSSRPARGRASRSCASRASTARSRWRRRSTAPASPRSTCT